MGRNKKVSTGRTVRHSTRKLENVASSEGTDKHQTVADILPAQSEDGKQAVYPDESVSVVDGFELVEGIIDPPVSPKTHMTCGTDMSTNVAFENDADESIQAESEMRLNPKDVSAESIDILGNGSVVKRVIRKGLGLTTRPNIRDLVIIEYKGWLEDDTLVEDVSNFSFSLGDGDVIHAFELALPLTDLNETFELLTDARFAYGSHGREPDIPPDAKLRYEVHLLSIQDSPDYGSMSPVICLAAANQKRERGNFYYRRDEFAFAVNSYNKALEILNASQEAEYAGDGGAMDASTRKSAHELEMKLYNNLAATQIKIEAFDAAIKSCDAVLLHYPDNFKALYRKGKALLGLEEASNAVKLLRQVHDQFPANALVVTELKRAVLMLEKQRERWSRASSRLFPDGNPKNHPGQKAAPVGRKWRILTACTKWSFFLVVALAILYAYLSKVANFYPESLK